jgi:hypothetical protein
LSWTAYIVAIVAGLSLVAFLPRRVGAPPRAMLLPPIVVAALAALWEMSVPRSANIRIDLLLVVPLLAFVEGAAGIALASHAKVAGRWRWAGASAIPAAICLAASAFVAVVWVVTGFGIAKETERSDRGKEWAFQAAFRDDATQRRVFGELEADPDHWAGYYVPEKPDVYPRRIVIAADGRYWTFGEHEYMSAGQREGDRGPERFRGRERRGVGVDLDLTKRPDGGFDLTRTFDGKTYTYAYRRERPPRFPRPAGSTQRVKYRGVFSGFVADGNSFRVGQLWIWEADGKRWGKYLWQGLTPGKESWIVAQRDATIDCADAACRTILVTATGEQPTRYSWIADDALQYDSGYLARGQKLILRPGEIVPGFLYDLAPLTDADENREWLHVVPDNGVYWTPPV